MIAKNNMLNYQLQLLNKDSKSLWLKTEKLLQPIFQPFNIKLNNNDLVKTNDQKAN